MLPDNYKINSDNILLLNSHIGDALGKWAQETMNVSAAVKEVVDLNSFKGKTPEGVKNYLSTVYTSGQGGCLPTHISLLVQETLSKMLVFESDICSFDRSCLYFGEFENSRVIFNKEMFDACKLRTDNISISFDDIHKRVLSAIKEADEVVNVEFPKPQTNSYEYNVDLCITTLKADIPNIEEGIQGLEENEISNPARIPQLLEEIKAIRELIAVYKGIGEGIVAFNPTNVKLKEAINNATVATVKGAEYLEENKSAIEIANATHDENVNRIIQEAADARREQGVSLVVNGVIATGIGVAAIIVTWGGATPVVVAAWVSGAGSILYGTSQIGEGAQDIHYANAGDINTPSFNYVRDTVFNGNQEAYDFVGGICVDTASSLIPVGLKGTTGVNTVGKVVVDSVASNTASYAVGKGCDALEIKGPFKTILMVSASMATSAGIDKAFSKASVATDVMEHVDDATKMSNDVQKVTDGAADAVNKADNLTTPGGAATVGKVDDATRMANDDVWKLKPTQRGNEIEKILSETEYKDWYNIGQSNNGYFPVIDFQKGNNVVSLKTIDPRLASYVEDGAFEQIKDYIDALDVDITVNDVAANKILDVRVPKGTRDLIDVAALKNYADSLNIKLKIGEF
ncbi:MAG: hypothetical protein J6X97_04445 [Lachnospiraceae bacterium]|nr:hypothetical protein [Lachnospiraceae bacterium]